MSKDIYALAEHRQGEMRDVTFEILTKAKILAKETGGSTVAVILGSGIDNLAESLKSYADKVVYIENDKLGHFHSEYYQEALKSLFEERKPFLMVMGHTSVAYELAPSLALKLDIPVITGCIDFRIDGSSVYSVNSVYGGKVNAEYSFNSENGGIVTILAGSMPAEEGGLSGELEKVSFSFDLEFEDKIFLQFVEAVAGEIDITQAEKIISIGRGIKEEENLAMIQELADSIGGVVACSRPIVDAGWLPKSRQVGSSGKTVKPKLYIAIGISGDFQHLMGMRNADTIIAINKDPNAPIFGAADYGIVDDLFKVVPALKDKVAELK
ncbi:electron transfer flavoprotein subunit alpha/FixB family protein [bacterium]|nr:electron transfer flavoprotein subunit alpha/FixB family protein [bacterium]